MKKKNKDVNYSTSLESSNSPSTHSFPILLSPLETPPAAFSIFVFEYTNLSASVFAS